MNGIWPEIGPAMDKHSAHEFVGFVHDLALQQLLYHVLNADDADGPAVARGAVRGRAPRMRGCGAGLPAQQALQDMQTQGLKGWLTTY